MPSFQKPHKVLQTNIIYFYILLNKKNYFAIYPLIFLHLYQIYFLNTFDAFVLDNSFHFFEHANKLIHMHIHQTSFMELTIILNQSQKQPLGAELFCIKSFLKILVKVLERIILQQSIFSTAAGQKPKLNSYMVIFQ